MTIIRRFFVCFVVFFRMMRVVFQVVYGVWKISYAPQPMISIFGGSRLQPDSLYARWAYELANKCVVAGISVLTGGGAGIMEAASCGAISGKAKAVSIGIGVKELGEGKNPCVQEYFELDYFFARKWLLTHNSMAFVVFPGGFGTLDELSEVLTLVQTNKLPRVPIILFGREYWDYFMKWVTVEALEHGLISKENLQLFTVTDDLGEAFKLICVKCKPFAQGA